MKVRWKIQMMGLVGRQVVKGKGDVTEVSDEDGARYCKLGYADPVAEKPTEKAEKAVVADDEEQRAPAADTADPDAKTVRQWAAEQDIDVPTRGKLPAEVVDQYKVAHEA